MKAQGQVRSTVVAELWGGPTDQNAFWFKSGNDAVLNPLFTSGTLTKGPQQFVPDWLANNAATDLPADAREDEQQDRRRDRGERQHRRRGHRRPEGQGT